MSSVPKKILVVDDSPTMRRMVSWVLLPVGLEVIEASDGKAALDILREQPVDLAIVDINMPVMDGIQLVRRIRERPGMKELPVIMLTTESRENEKKLAQDAGVTSYLVKPALPPEIRSMVCSLLESSGDGSAPDNGSPR